MPLLLEVAATWLLILYMLSLGVAALALIVQLVDASIDGVTLRRAAIFAVASLWIAISIAALIHVNQGTLP